MCTLAWQDQFIKYADTDTLQGFWKHLSSKIWIIWIRTQFKGFVTYCFEKMEMYGTSRKLIVLYMINDMYYSSKLVWEAIKLKIAYFSQLY